MDLRRSPVADVLDAMAADQPSPGSGAAAGIVLALAAACLAKALRIAGRRGEDPGLAEAAERAEALGRLALRGAQDDCEDFPAVLRSPADAVAQARLEADGAASLELCRGLRHLIETYAETVPRDLQGDVAAASHLVTAAEHIHARNLDEGTSGTDGG